MTIGDDRYWQNFPSGLFNLKGFTDYSPPNIRHKDLEGSRKRISNTLANKRAGWYGTSRLTKVGSRAVSSHGGMWRN